MVRDASLEQHFRVFLDRPIEPYEGMYIVDRQRFGVKQLAAADDHPPLVGVVDEVPDRARPGLRDKQRAAAGSLQAPLLSRGRQLDVAVPGLCRVAEAVPQQHPGILLDVEFAPFQQVGHVAGEVMEDLHHDHPHHVAFGDAWEAFALQL